MNKVLKIIIVFVIVCITLVVIIFYRRSSIIENSSYKTKYNTDAKIEDLNLHTIDDYVDYLKDMLNTISPIGLQKLINIDSKYAKRYFNSDDTKQEDGNKIIMYLKNRCYRNLLEIIIKKDQNWSELPLTENFRKKFNEKDGIITEVDVKPFTIKDFSDPGIDPLPTLEYEYPLYLKDFSFDKKTFSVVYDFVSDDAYEKYSDYNIYYMVYEGAGAYNEDLYNYEFVLDKDGYLDDIVFKDITHLVVEGRNVK